MSRVQQYDFYIKKTNTGPDIQVQLLDEDGDPINITGYSTIKFKMRNKETQVGIVDANATVDDPTTGLVRYTWSALDTANAGDYEGEFVVVMSNGQSVSFPNNGYIEIRINESI